MEEERGGWMEAKAFWLGSDDDDDDDDVGLLESDFVFLLVALSVLLLALLVMLALLLDRFRLCIMLFSSEKVGGGCLVGSLLLSADADDTSAKAKDDAANDDVVAEVMAWDSSMASSDA